MLTLTEKASAKIKVKRSEFLAFIFPIHKLEDIESELKQLRKSHPKARHICWAYRFYSGNEVMEYSTDAGEPDGTAGLPILNQLRHGQRVNIGCVVVRHFGGVKLGKRGLSEAYREAAVQAIESGNFIKYIPQSYFGIRGPYSFYGEVVYFLNQIKGQIIRDDSSDQLNLMLKIPSKFESEFKNGMNKFQGLEYKKMEQA